MLSRRYSKKLVCEPHNSTPASLKSLPISELLVGFESLCPTTIIFWPHCLCLSAFNIILAVSSLPFSSTPFRFHKLPAEVSPWSSFIWIRPLLAFGRSVLLQRQLHTGICLCTVRRFTQQKQFALHIMGSPYHNSSCFIIIKSRQATVSDYICLKKWLHKKCSFLFLIRPAPSLCRALNCSAPPPNRRLSDDQWPVFCSCKV